MMRWLLPGLVVLCLLSTTFPLVRATDPPSPWTVLPLPMDVRASAFAVTEDAAYSMGGVLAGSPSPLVFRAPITGGAVGAWEATTSLPAAQQGSGFAISGKLVVAGGPGGGFACNGNRVFLGSPGPDGSILWESARSLPADAGPMSFAVNGDRVFFGGGNAGGGCSGYPDGALWTTTFDGVEFAPWVAIGRFPGDLKAGVALAPSGEWLYAVGGEMCCPGEPVVGTWRASLAPDGAIGTWIAGPDLPAPTAYGSAFASRGYITFAGGGGDSSGEWRPEVRQAKLNPDGSLGAWSVVDSAPLRIDPRMASVTGLWIGMNQGSDASGTDVPYSSLLYRTADPGRPISIDVSGPQTVVASSTARFVAHGRDSAGTLFGPFVFDWTAPSSPQVALACHAQDDVEGCLAVTVLESPEGTIRGEATTTRSWVTTEADRIVSGIAGEWAQVQDSILGARDSIIIRVGEAEATLLGAVEQAKVDLAARIAQAEASILGAIGSARDAVLARTSEEAVTTRSSINETAEQTQLSVGDEGDETRAAVKQDGDSTRAEIARIEKRHLDVTLAQPWGSGSQAQIVISAFVGKEGTAVTDAQFAIRVDGQAPTAGQWSRTHMGHGLYRLSINVDGGIVRPHDVIVTATTVEAGQTLTGVGYFATRPSGSV